jgi:translocation and assembly module TamB
VLGDAWGEASFAYEAVGERRTRIDIRVPNLELELPEMTPRGVQSLEPAEHVDVGFQRRDGTFVEIPLQPLEEPDDDGSRLIVGLELGKIRIEKGPGVRIELTGSLEARVAKRTRLDGRIELTGGRLDVSGKEFVVENGSITFDRTQPENGVVVARARWDSPAQYAVYAEYTGTVKDGSLDLRSEPPLTEDEILSLLLFGTPDGSFGAGTRSEAAAAIGVAGGTVTKGVNRALSDITNLDVSTRVDTSTGAARPELVVQLSPRTTGRVTQAIGEPSPGQSPDRTFLTLDLRLFRKWSLSTQVGDEGASTVDLIWRHRY